MEPTMPQACGEIDRLRNRADWVESLQRTNHRLYEQCQERLADKDAKIADLTAERDHLREAFDLQDRAIRERVSVTQARAEADHARDIALWLVAEARAERDEARERWTDLRERLQRAESVLTQNGKYDTGMRLQVKAQGVALALSYMGDAERIAASQSANPDPPAGSVQEFGRAALSCDGCGCHLFDHTLVAERDEARTRLLKSEEDCKRLIAERDEARRERDSYMVQAHKIASDRDMLRDQTDDILDYQQQIADLTRERDEAREDWRMAQVNLQHASATRRHSAFAMSEWLRDAVEVGLLLRACYGPEQPNSIARLDALIAEWRAAADDFASRND